VVVVVVAVVVVWWWWEVVSVTTAPSRVAFALTLRAEWHWQHKEDRDDGRKETCYVGTIRSTTIHLHQHQPSSHVVAAPTTATRVAAMRERTRLR
jgi:hypothetical protein